MWAFCSLATCGQRSTSAFRSRFIKLLQALRLPWNRPGPYPRFAPGEVVDLGSLRCGGTAELHLRTDNESLARRRGRWTSARQLAIYLREASATTFLSRLRPGIRSNLQRMASCTAQIVDRALELLHSRVPCSDWPGLLGPIVDAGWSAA